MKLVEVANFSVLQSGPASLGTALRTGDPKAASVGGLVHIRPSLSMFPLLQVQAVDIGRHVTMFRANTSPKGEEFLGGVDLTMSNEDAHTFM